MSLILGILQLVPLEKFLVHFIKMRMILCILQLGQGLRIVIYGLASVYQVDSANAKG
jgi:hypothetical protein